MVSVTLEHGPSAIVITSVPADFCENCGEEHLSEETTREIFAETERAAASGATVEIRTYRAA